MGGAAEAAWYRCARTSTTFPAHVAASCGSAAPPHNPDQETIGCLVDASSWPPSGKDCAAWSWRHTSQRYVPDASFHPLSGTYRGFFRLRFRASNFQTAGLNSVVVARPAARAARDPSRSGRSVRRANDDDLHDLSKPPWRRKRVGSSPPREQKAAFHHTPLRTVAIARREVTIDVTMMKM